MGAGDKGGLEGRGGEKHAACQGGAVPAPEQGDIGRLRLRVVADRAGREEDSPHRARVSDAGGHPVPPRGVRYTRNQPGSSPLQRLIEPRARRLPQGGQSGRHRDRVAGQGPGLIHRAGGRHEAHEIRAAAIRADRQAAPHDLAERRQVGAHAETLLGAARGDSEAGHHLIEDQQRPVGVTQPPQGGMELRFGRDEAHVAEIRLDDDGRELRAPPAKHVLHGRDVVERHGEREARHGGRHARAVRQAERGHARAGLHQKAVGVAVVAARELEDELALGGRPGHPHRAHRRLGAAVHEPDHLERRHPAPHELCELHLGLARRAVAPPPPGRYLNRLQHCRVSVAQDERSPGADIVDVGPAIDIGEATPGRARDEKGRPAYCTERPDRRVDASGEHLSCPLEQLRRARHASATARKS